MQPFFAQARAQLGRLQEFPPLVRAARQPAQHIFRPGNGERVGFHRAVEGGHEQDASRLYQCRAGVQERGHVGDMLDNLESEDDVEGEG